MCQILENRMLYSYRVAHGLWTPSLEEFRKIEQSSLHFALTRFRVSVLNLVKEIRKVYE